MPSEKQDIDIHVSDKINSYDVGVARIVNPVAELYLDGIFCSQQTAISKNAFIKWRYERLTVLALFASLEAAINSIPSTNVDDYIKEKWSPKFDKQKEKKEWDIFMRFKEVRISLQHYNGSEIHEKSFYEVLDDKLSEFIDVTKFMLNKIFPTDVVAEWESNLTPRDATLE